MEAHEGPPGNFFQRRNLRAEIKGETARGKMGTTFYIFAAHFNVEANFSVHFSKNGFTFQRVKLIAYNTNSDQLQMQVKSPDAAARAAGKQTSLLS